MKFRADTHTHTE